MTAYPPVLRRAHSKTHPLKSSHRPCTSTSLARLPPSSLSPSSSTRVTSRFRKRDLGSRKGKAVSCVRSKAKPSPRAAPQVSSGLRLTLRPTERPRRCLYTWPSIQARISPTIAGIRVKYLALGRDCVIVSAVLENEYICSAPPRRGHSIEAHNFSELAWDEGLFIPATGVDSGDETACSILYLESRAGSYCNCCVLVTSYRPCKPREVVS